MSQHQLASYGLQNENLQPISDQHQLDRDVIRDWQAMQQAASQSGIRLQIVSSYRSFSRQAAIWNAKFTGQRSVLDDLDRPVDLNNLSELQIIEAIQRFSAMPGTSRHHWGTELDIYDPTTQVTPLLLTPSEYQSGGPQEQTAHWLNENAAAFGFFLPYGSDLGGVGIEPWHISHRARSHFYAQQWQLDDWLTIIEQHQVSGWGTIKQHAESLVERFMKRINEG